MIRIFQFGEGNFLRTFVEHYFDVLNEEGGDYRVTIIPPIPTGIPLSLFAKSQCRYNILLRGVQDGRPVEKIRQIRAVERVFSPFEDEDAFYEAAADPDLHLIVSNTTEAGIAFRDSDRIDGFREISYPAKLTKFLYARYLAGQGGVYLLPVELIDHNADCLKDCVNRYIALWELPEDFRLWNERENYYCNTLVDRIVSGAPKTEADRARADELVGYHDPLLSVGEPFGLWAIENKGNLSEYIREGHHGIDVILTDSIDSYKKRKVRILNGSHTNLVPAGLFHGMTTVYDCMTDKTVRAFIISTAEEEILPVLGEDATAARSFADAMIGRFENPFLDHRLISIALNSISKWQARVLPTVQEYVDRFGKLPRRLTVGLSYLMALYSCIRKTEDGYVAAIPGGRIPVSDDAEHLSYFAEGGSVREFLGEHRGFGSDLREISGLVEAVEQNVADIMAGGDLLV